jgi:hypothetical protein
MFIWTAQDPRGFDDATTQALARCSSGAWGIDEIGDSKGTAEEDLLILIARSLVVRQALLAAGNASLYPLPSGNKLSLNVIQGSWGNPVSDVDHQNAQYILLRTWEVLAKANGWTESDASQLSATSGKDASATTNVVAIVAIVVGIIVLAGLIAFTVYNVNTLIDRSLARRAQAQELMRAHAECQKMLEDHAAAERSAGKPIPFSIAELAVMARLAKLQDSASKGFEATLVPPLGGAPPKTATDVIGDVLTLAVVLGFGYFLIRREI